MTTRRRVLAAGSILAIGLGLAACGSEEISLKAGESDSIKEGAALFADRCSGCHTLDVAGAQGGATQIHDRERVDGPNFNVRKEDRDSVLYAIRNGGFSGAIMPQNIVVGKQADAVAAFLAKYAGSQGKSSPTPPQTVEANQAQQQTTSTPEAAAANGKQVFTSNCAACHTLKDANATGQVGPNLDDAKPDAATTEKQVTNGGGAMPPFKGTLSDAEITAVSQYVADATGAGGQAGGQQGTTSAPAQSAAADGKKLFTDNCGACHTLKDASATGQVGPNLDDLKPDEATTEKQVTNGGGAMPPFKGQLSDAEIKAISQYVASAAGK